MRASELTLKFVVARLCDSDLRNWLPLWRDLSALCR
jgi:hypothetical protein